MKTSLRIPALAAMGVIAAAGSTQTLAQQVVQAVKTGNGSRALMRVAMLGVGERFTQGVPANLVSQYVHAPMTFYAGSNMPPVDANGQATLGGVVRPHFFMNEASAVSANQVKVYFVIPGGKNANNQYCNNVMQEYTLNVNINQFVNLIKTNTANSQYIAAVREYGRSYGFTQNDSASGKPYPINANGSLPRPMNLDNVFALVVSRHHCLGASTGALPGAATTDAFNRRYTFNNFNNAVRNSNAKVAAGVQYAGTFLGGMQAPYGGKFADLPDTSQQTNPHLTLNGKFFHLDRANNGVTGSLPPLYGVYGWDSPNFGGRRPVGAMNFRFPGNDWAATGGPGFKAEVDMENLNLAVNGALFPVKRDGSTYGHTFVYLPGTFQRNVLPGEENLWNNTVATDFETRVNNFLSGNQQRMALTNSSRRNAAEMPVMTLDALMQPAAEVMGPKPAPKFMVKGGLVLAQ